MAIVINVIDCLPCDTVVSTLHALSLELHSNLTRYLLLLFPFIHIKELQLSSNLTRDTVRK